MVHFGPEYYSSIRRAIGPLPGWVTQSSTPEIYTPHGLVDSMVDAAKSGDPHVWSRRLPDGSLLAGRKGSGYHVHSRPGRYAVLTNESYRPGDRRRHSRMY